MGLFGKKRPLYEYVKSSTHKRPARWIDAHHKDENALAGVIALMVADGASHLVRTGVPKNHGKAIDADVYAFEVEAYFAHVFHTAFYADTDYTKGTPYLSQQWARGFGQMCDSTDRLCGWATLPVFKARLAEYQLPDATGFNLFGTLMVVGNATTPLVEYLRPMDLQINPPLEAGIAGLTALGD